MRKKASFTHVRDNLRGEVSGKVLVRTSWRETWKELERADVAKGGQVLGESDGKRVGRDGKWVGSEMWDCVGWELCGWETV